jgi:hypothetical protein
MTDQVSLNDIKRGDGIVIYAITVNLPSGQSRAV